MTPDVNPVAVLDEYRDRFSEAYVTVKGPSVGGTRYEVEREIDTRIAAELIKRGRLGNHQEPVFRVDCGRRLDVDVVRRPTRR